MFNVHLRINDAATGLPTPVRLRISDAAGRVYPPLGRFAEFAHGRNEDVGGHVLLGREAWHYIDGACEVPLPGGTPLIIEATKGPEYRPLRQELMLGVGQMALRLNIERAFDLRSEGWYSGDTRCHFLPPHAALLEAMAEDLAVVQLLATETTIASQDGTAYPSVSNLLAFSGQQPCLERDGHVVAVNTLNRHPVLGNLALLHCHRAVYPLSFGGPDATDDWSLADWCDQCHRKKGLVVWADPFRTEAPVAPEALADLILGRIDAVECVPEPPAWRLRDIYRSWSAGNRFPLVGASAKASNRMHLGALRTYAKLGSGEAPSLAAWIGAVRKGRTLVTNGPFINFSVNEREADSILDLEGLARVNVRAEWRWHAPLTVPVELVVNGVVIHRIDPPVPPRVTVERDYPIDEPSWIATRTAAAPSSHTFAHSSPIFVRVGGRMPAHPGVIDQMRASLQGTIDWVETEGRFENPRRKEQLRAVLEQARQELLARREAC